MCIKKIFNGNDSFCIQSISRVKMASNPCLKYAPSWGGGEKWWVFTWLTTFPNRSVAIIKQ